MCEHTFVRWESQAVEQDDAGRLPGLGGTVIRRFNVPEALDTRFHEVRTKSALNRVPGAARLPFSWTVNPYRGCSHACVYCLGSDTPILLADGRTKPISDVSVGEAIYGTVRQGGHRRYARTEVLARWSTVKPAYRVVLADGTELVASGDHRFLTAGGWRHVTGAQHGPERRPHLSLRSELMGTGAPPSPAVEDDDYRRGYLSGFIRGDAHLATDAYAGAGRRHGDAHSFRLTLADLEAIE